MAVNTEKTVNTVLGEIVRARHPGWRDTVYVEQTQVFSGAPAQSPDIVIDGLIAPVVVETEFEPANTVIQDAKSRLGKRLASNGKEIEHVIACRLPDTLKIISQSDLKGALETATFGYRVISVDSEKKENIWPRDRYTFGSINDLIDCIDVVGLSDSLVTRCTNILEEGLTQVQHIMERSSPELGSVLRQEPGLQTNRMAAAIIANALIFHISIEDQEQIRHLSDIVSEKDVLIRKDVVESWYWIVENINYWPIFRIASNLLMRMPVAQSNGVLNSLYSTVQRLAELGAQNLNDLSGRVFQRLIVDRKFLATFYTLPVSATLLSEIVAERLNTDWSNSMEVTQLRIADWACGTGTLIGAMYQTILGRFRKYSDDEFIHSRMLENAIYAFDIMPAATHLTSSTLASVHSGTPFKKTKVVTMPYGEMVGYSQPQIGSLELLADESINPLFSLGRSILTGDIESERLISVGDGSVDVVIMNPPFTRPTNHERITSAEGVPVPSFAGFGTTVDEQKAMARRLVELLKSHRKKGKIASHGNAGLATNFFDLAHAKLAEGGILALVLPFTFVQGDSWRNARQILEKHYNDIVVISIATDGNKSRAFSADTGMAEVLVVATKRISNDESECSVRYVNLYERPLQQIEAMVLGRQIARNKLDLGSEIGANTLESGGYAAVKNVNTLSRVALSLKVGRLELPHGVVEDIPMTKLGELGKRGLHVLDISGNKQKSGEPPRGPFVNRKLVKDDAYPEYPALWSHDAQRETKLVVSPDNMCEPKPECEDHANHVWREFASRLHVTVDFQLNSQPLAACLTHERTLGGRAWPNFVLSDRSWERICALWLNTTLGVISFWWIATRSQQGRASVTVSRHTELVSIDPRHLTPRQLENFDEIFDEFRDRQFLPANEAYCDETRQELDEVVICELLKYPKMVLQELNLIRNQWCSEPSVHGGKSTRSEYVA